MEVGKKRQEGNKTSTLFLPVFEGIAERRCRISRQSVAIVPVETVNSQRRLRPRSDRCVGVDLLVTHRHICAPPASRERERCALETTGRQHLRLVWFVLRHGCQIASIETLRVGCTQLDVTTVPTNVGHNPRALVIQDEQGSKILRQHCLDRCLRVIVLIDKGHIADQFARAATDAVSVGSRVWFRFVPKIVPVVSRRFRFVLAPSFQRLFFDLTHLSEQLPCIWLLNSPPVESAVRRPGRRDRESQSETWPLDRETETRATTTDRSAPWLAPDRH